jgi:hypothetical protein
MKAPKRPADGWPWEKRSPMFSIPNWPPGFVPSAIKSGELQAWHRSQIASKARDVQIQNGHTGAILGLSDKSDRMIRNARDVRQLVPKR